MSVIDDLFDKAGDFLDIAERIAGNDGVLPMSFDDGSKVIADSIAGGSGEPAWIVLRFYRPNGDSYTKRYVLEGEARGSAKLLAEGERR